MRLLGGSLLLYGVGVLSCMGLIRLPLNGVMTDADLWVLCFVFASSLILFFCLYTDKKGKE